LLFSFISHFGLVIISYRFVVQKVSACNKSFVNTDKTNAGKHYNYSRQHYIINSACAQNGGVAVTSLGSSTKLLYVGPG